MTQLDITQAKTDLSKLLDLAIKGEEIVISFRYRDLPTLRLGVPRYSTRTID
jgi:hypothetical protein